MCLNVTYKCAIGLLSRDKWIAIIIEYFFLGNNRSYKDYFFKLIVNRTTLVSVSIPVDLYSVAV